MHLCTKFILLSASRNGNQYKFNTTTPLLKGKRQVNLSSLPKRRLKGGLITSERRRLWLISTVSSGLKNKSLKKKKKKGSVNLFPKADIFKTLTAWQFVLKSVGILLLISALQSQPSSLVFNRSFGRS